MVKKKIVMVIASANFRDEEYFHPRQVLEEKGFEVVVSSSSQQIAVGKLGARVKPDLTVEQVETADYDGLIFVGGGGSREYFHSATAHKLARGIYSSHKPLGAICIAPAILALSGLLGGRKFTSFPSVVDEIKALGGVFEDAEVVRDGLILTANGAEAAILFGQNFAAMFA